MKIKVVISNLGREKFSGTFFYTGTKQELINDIEKEISKHLISSSISISKPFFTKGKTNVYAGFHKVGEVEVK